MNLHLTGNPDADELLSDDPLALLVGMLLDHGMPGIRKPRALSY